MNILIIIAVFFISLLLVKLNEKFWKTLRYVRLQKVRKGNWNSFTGFSSEQEQIEETKRRC